MAQSSRINCGQMCSKDCTQNTGHHPSTHHSVTEGLTGFHKFLKATIGKQLQKGLKWDDVIPKATSAYNFFPTQSSKEAPFFLMFGRQAAVKHMLLDSESPKYLGNEEGLLNIELMRKLSPRHSIQLSKI